MDRHPHRIDLGACNLSLSRSSSDGLLKELLDRADSNNGVYFFSVFCYLQNSMVSVTVTVKPELLRWAIDRAGLQVEDLLTVQELKNFLIG
tara:strand:+ start:501 stop:773 length:273 start_codon:yes stop_codon:yes gene_type:complete